MSCLNNNIDSDDLKRLLLSLKPLFMSSNDDLKSNKLNKKGRKNLYYPINFKIKKCIFDGKIIDNGSEYFEMDS